MRKIILSSNGYAWSTQCRTIAGQKMAATDPYLVRLIEAGEKLTGNDPDVLDLVRRLHAIGETDFYVTNGSLSGLIVKTLEGDEAVEIFENHHGEEELRVNYNVF